MSIDKVSRLFSAFTSTTTKPATSEQSASVQKSAQDGDDSVRIAKTFGQASDDSEASERAAKVARIKSQVDAGTYKPDTTAVAEAVARDLFA